VISYVLAFLSALVNATSDVLNRKASREVPAHLHLRIGLLGDLLRRRTWLVAVALMIVSFLLAAAALGTGQLASVQLIVILELPLTLIGSTVVLGNQLEHADWVAMAALTGGVIGLLALLNPQHGTSGPVPAPVWVAGTAISVAVMVVLYLAGLAQPLGALRAALLGIASGCGYGLTAAFTKGMSDEYIAGGVSGVLGSWQIYACGAAGITSTWLLQNAYHAGTLAAAQPGITLTDPLVSNIWGIAVFGEQVRVGWILLLGVFPLAAIVAGVLGLSRSSALRLNQEDPRQPGTRSRRAG
jgi:drug/metabolite transporter (DMT)-like permease